ncbi:MAG: ABC transporter permease [Thermoplasmatota archaeon]
MNGVDRSEFSSLAKLVLISLGASIFILLIMLPMSSLFRFAFEDGLEGFWRAATSEKASNAFTNSLIVAAAATAINLVVGTLVAYVVTRYHFIGRSVFRSLIDLPIAIPTAVVGLALMILYGPQGLLGSLLESSGFKIVMAKPGVILAHIFVTFPFVVRSVSVSLEKFDRDLEDAARTLGASGPRIFLKVVLPSIRSGIISGCAMVFTRSLGEFGATLFIAGGMVMTGPLYIYYLSDSSFDYQAATSVAIVLLVIPFLLLLTTNIVVSRMEDGK